MRRPDPVTARIMRQRTKPFRYPASSLKRWSRATDRLHDQRFFKAWRVIASRVRDPRHKLRIV